ncbi:restriction endonuclease [Vibrio parahaemolyticus]|uniref:Probable endonuclease n=3 Tax=Vibrionaceae TaxID=641 RepID=A0A3Q0L5R2_VIBVU|nr:Probable endonuclease [Vibrio vulnificus CMCP6]OXD06761.1 restriction endonuclease [Vibrio parahaemolyticus]TOF78099.1 restriction endonuclease [Vibrio parahaemolyticus]TOF85804.1 restriction endonuclease [Vibrio parahaemolyticus]TOF86891.1 restriction endonuclease [Vibrio parahaemolyticus]
MWMWQFVGEIEYECSSCSSYGEIPIDEFDCECLGGSERSMGDEEIYELSCAFECDDCARPINLAFEVSEYPIGLINFIIDKCDGATALNEPDIEYIREIYSARDLFDLYSSVSELVIALQAEPALLTDLEPRQFEEVTAEIFRDKGFEVELTKRTRDGGKDVIAFHKDQLGIRSKYIIECKHYADTNKVGVDIVRALYGVKNSRSGGNVGIIVTTSTFTSGAREFIENEATTNLDLTLADKEQLLEWLKGYGKN